MKTFAAALLFGATVAIRVAEDGTEVEALGTSDEMQMVQQVAEALYHCTDRDGDGALSLGEIDRTLVRSNKIEGVGKKL